MTADIIAFIKVTQPETFYGHTIENMIIEKGIVLYVLTESASRENIKFNFQKRYIKIFQIFFL